METKTPKRKYQLVWERIISDPKKPVKIRAHPEHGVPLAELMQRIRKAVWKEKERYKVKLADGKTYVKELWLLTCEMNHEDGTLLFQLKPTNHPENL